MRSSGAGCDRIFFHLYSNASVLRPILLYLQRTTKGGKAMERLRKKLSEQESLLLLMSPSMAFRVANRNGKVSLLLYMAGLYTESRA